MDLKYHINMYHHKRDQKLITKYKSCKECRKCHPVEYISHGWLLTLILSYKINYIRRSLLTIAIFYSKNE